MLQLIRERSKGLLVWTIVGLIIITFALFGLSSYLGGSGSAASIAEVNDTEISQNQLLRAQRNYLERLQQIQGEQFDPSLFDNKEVKRQVLQGLIRRELIQQHINEVGYRPSPEQVINSIHSYPVFQEDGKFSRDRYRTLLRQEGIAPEQFERDVASDLASDQLRRGVAGSAFVTDSELKRYLDLKYQQRQIGYLVLKLERFLDKVQPEQSQIEQYYQDNRDQFMTPEQVSIDFIDLDLKQLSKQYEVSQQEVEQYYEAHRNNYIEQPERREVSHILIAINAERTQDQALGLTQELARKLDQGADFSRLAREYSDDPGSASQGGDLGLIQPGIFDPEFERVALELKQGAISEPVKTQFGYHLIRADVVKPATVKPLAKVEEQIRQELRMRQAEQEFYEKVDALSRYSYEMPDSLQGVAEQVGLKVEQSSMFTRRGGKGLTAEPKVVNAAFSEDVLKSGRNSDVLELSDTRYLVLRVNEHQPARARPLEEVKEEIAQRLKQQQAQELAIQTAREIKSALAKGEPADKVAANYKVDWQTPGLIGRRPGQDEKLDIAIRRTAFAMPVPAAGESSAVLTPVRGGNVAVIQLQSVRPGELPSGQQLERERQQLSTAYGLSEYEALLEDLRNQAEIRISDELSDEQS